MFVTLLYFRDRIIINVLSIMFIAVFLRCWSFVESDFPPSHEKLMKEAEQHANFLLLCLFFLGSLSFSVFHPFLLLHICLARSLLVSMSKPCLEKFFLCRVGMKSFAHKHIFPFRITVALFEKRFMACKRAYRAHYYRSSPGWMHESFTLNASKVSI